MTNDVAREELIKKMIMKMRKQTNIAITLCREAIEEANLNEDIAMQIARKKCSVIGEKYFNNPEKQITNYFVYVQKDNNAYNVVKIGTQSEYSGTNKEITDLSKKIMSTLITRELSYVFMDTNDIEEVINKKSDLKEDLLYLAGLLRENIQVMNVGKITGNNLYISKKNLIEEVNNFLIASGISIFSSNEAIEDANSKSVLININARIKNVKNINIEEFMNHISVDNKSLKIRDLLKTAIIDKILVV